jgi:tetratricopeptide (TPR) repeat protein
VEQALGKYDEALQNYEKALAISQKGADFRAVSSMLRQLADLERSRGRLEEAERLASNSLKIALELKDQIGIAYSLVGLGLIDQDMRKFEEAEKHLMESLKIVQDLGDRKMEANIHGQLGRIAEDRGDLRQARKCYERALEISRELNFEPFLTRLEDDLNHVQSKLQETVEKPAAPAERAGLMQRPTGGTKIASVLDMLADGDWHTFKEVCAKTGIAADQTQHLAEFLAEYEFVVIDKTGGRLKLTERVRTYLSKVMKIEDSRKRIGLSK